jgi:hypothetical protein
MTIPVFEFLKIFLQVWEVTFIYDVASKEEMCMCQIRCSGRSCLGLPWPIHNPGIFSFRKPVIAVF